MQHLIYSNRLWDIADDDDDDDDDDESSKNPKWDSSDGIQQSVGDFQNTSIGHMKSSDLQKRRS